MNAQVQPQYEPYTISEDPIPMLLTNWAHPDYDPIFRERAKRMQFLRDTEEKGTSAWAEIRQHYADKPVLFINDWGMTTDPRNAEIGLPVAVPFILFKRQVEFVEWLHERWLNREDGLVEKSRDMGVSWLCVAFAVWMMKFHRGSVVGFGSRKEDYVDKIDDPKSLFWKIRKFISFLPIELRPKNWNERKDSPSMRANDREMESSIVGEAGDNIGRGNRTSLYFVDEAAHLEHPDSADAALQATSNCKIHVSSVNGAGNPFYKKRHGGEIPVFIFDWRQDPRKNQSWYDKQKRILDPVILAQEVDRNYEASISNAFIPGELVTAAMNRQAQPRGRLRVGVDVARFGDDKTSIVFRMGRVMLKKIKLSKMDVAHVAGRVRAEIVAYGTKPEQIAVDTIGIGAGVADMLRGWYPDVYNHQTGKTTKIVADINASTNLDNGVHFNVRAMMWSEMKGWLATASLPPDDNELKVDLTALRYTFRFGELLLESKADAKKRGVKSPDDGDALALTFAEPTIPEPDAPQARGLGYRPTDASMGM